MKLLLMSLSAFLCIATTGTYGQDNQAKLESMRFGIYARHEWISHSAEFSKLPGVPNCCPQFESGSGTGFDLGAFARIRLGDLWTLDLALSYTQSTGTLSADESTEGSDAGVPIPVAFKHTIDSKLASIGIEPVVAYRLIGGLSGVFGGRFGFVTTHTYSQLEEIVSPSDRGVFKDTQARTRNSTGGEIPDIQPINAGLLGGLRYSLPLSRRGLLVAEPEFICSYQFTNVVKATPWKMLALSAGVRITFGIPEAAPVVETPAIPPPPPPALPPPVIAAVPPPPELNANVTATALDENGVESPVAKIVLEEFVATTMTPLLGQVFFDEGSSVVPVRYHAMKPIETNDFNIDNFHAHNALDVYHDLLNIVGYRMRMYPNARLTLTGCNANTGMESGALALSQARAESVRSYLLDVWNIDSSRIDISTRGLPAKPSNPEIPDGIAENRRVELESDTWEILEPVTSNSIERRISPPAIKFRTNASATCGLNTWSLAVIGNGTNVKTMSGQGMPPTDMDWLVGPDELHIPGDNAILSYSLTVLDSAKHSYTTPARSIELNKITISRKRMERRGDVEINRYSLILFDFDNNQLNPANKRIASIIRSRVLPGAEVIITGHTDRIGDSKYNKALSEGRAQSTARELGGQIKSARGLGKSEYLFDNDLPEGRVYSRTVNIVVETPVR